MTAVLFFEEIRFPLELYAALLVFLLPFGKRKDRFTGRVISAFAAGVLLASLYFPIFGSKAEPRFYFLQAFWYVIIAATTILVARWCFLVTWCDALFMSILAFATQNIVYVILHEWIARRMAPALRDHLLWYVVCAVLVCAAVYSAVYILFQQSLTLASPALFEDEPRSFLFYCLLFVMTITCIFYYQAAFSGNRKGYGTNSWLIELSFCVFILIIQYSLIRSRSLSNQKELLEQALANNSRYYEMTKETVAIINRKCHDFKHQLKALAMMSEADRQHYIQEAQDNILFYQNLVHSDNPVINTILAEKGLFCEEKNIKLTCTVGDVPADFMSVTDLYAVLGNAIDNAIEYVSKLSNPAMRIISFSLSRKNNFVNIQINNPYLETELGGGHLPQTTKPDKINHGFGLRSIEYLAKKYNGQMEIATHDNLFTLQILIPIVVKN